MNSTPNSTSTNVLIARADEQLARVHERIAGADEQIARVTEQLSKLERDDARNPSVGPGPQPSRAKWAMRGLIGLFLVACILIAAFVSQSSRDGVRLIVTPWVPRLVSTSSAPPIKSPTSGQPAPSFQVITAEAAPSQAAPPPPAGQQDAAPPAAGASELIQLLQTMARHVANMEREVEELRLKQDQIAADNSKAIEQLKAKQEDMARLLAKPPEQSAGPTTSTPPAGSAPASKPAPTQSQQVRARPPAPRPRWQPWRYYYEDW